MTDIPKGDYTITFTAEAPVLNHFTPGKWVERKATHPILAPLLYRFISFVENHLDPDDLEHTANRWAGKPYWQGHPATMPLENYPAFTFGDSIHGNTVCYNGAAGSRRILNWLESVYGWPRRSDRC